MQGGTACCSLPFAAPAAYLGLGCKEAACLAGCEVALRAAACRALCRQSIRLFNPSKLPAKFEVVPQEEGSMGLATYTVEPPAGGVPAMGEQVRVVACVTCLHGLLARPACGGL